MVHLPGVEASKERLETVDRRGLMPTGRPWWNVFEPCSRNGLLPLGSDVMRNRVNFGYPVTSER